MSDSNSTFTGNKSYAYSFESQGNVAHQGYTENVGYVKNYSPFYPHFDKVTVNSTSGATLTTSQFKPSAYINRTGTNGAGFADTLPAASALLALVPNKSIGDSFVVYYYNNGTGQTCTITAPDTTVSVKGTATIANNTTKALFCTVVSTDSSATPAIELLM